MKQYDTLVSIPVTLDERAAREVFLGVLEELTEGWYIAKAQALARRGIMVLCKDGPPHPHNGDTSREHEKPLDEKGMEVIRAACELIHAIRNKKQEPGKPRFL